MTAPGSILIRHIVGTLPNGHAERRALIEDTLEVVATLETAPEGRVQLAELAEHLKRADEAQMNFFQGN
jgi:hypothetical protein